MSYIKNMPITELVNYKYSRLVKDFYFESDVLKKRGLRHKVIIPSNFTMDWESIPLIKGTSKVAGLIHDYLCRKDSEPIVTKKIAADVYLEFMKYRQTPFVKRQIKYWAVMMAWGYFHKLDVFWNKNG